MSDSLIRLNFAPAKPKAPKSDSSKPNSVIGATKGRGFDKHQPNKRKSALDIKSSVNKSNDPTAKRSKFYPEHDTLKPVSEPLSTLESNRPSKPRKPFTPKLVQPKPTQRQIKSDDESEIEDKKEVPIPQSDPKKSYVISSLFTGNPLISKGLSNASLSSMPKDASNGVLSDAPTFEAAGLDRILANHLVKNMGMDKPTTVQSRVLSFLEISGHRDLVIQAQTGSGKTLSFLLPIVDKLIKASGAVSQSDSFRPSRTSGVLAVVLAPTRELAHQIYEVLVKLLNYPVVSDHSIQRYHWIVPGLVVGGDKRASEKARIRKGVNILIATPGRFLDHLQNTKNMNVNSLKWVVLDEGDRFLELGLQETLKSIFKLLDEKSKSGGFSGSSGFKGRWFWNSQLLPRKRMTMMVSATLNHAVRTLAEYSLTNPMHITADKISQGIDSDDSDEDSSDDSDAGLLTNSFATPHQLTQQYLVVPAKLRLVSLAALLNRVLEENNGKVIVFMLTCEEVEFYTDLFKSTSLAESSDSDDLDDGVDADPTTVSGHYRGSEKYFNLGKVFPGLPILKLHGNLDQSIRTGTYKAFCALNSGVLFCTDVAARGLDLPRVNQIIQFDPPTDVKDYVHRVGRTARLGKVGEAILFLLPSEVEYLSRLKALNITLAAGAIENTLQYLVDREGGSYQAAATFYQNSFERYVISSPKVEEQAGKALISSIRAYATHPSTEKDIFHVKRLHLGHWAKAFALREAPTAITQRMGSATPSTKGKPTKGSSYPSYASKAGMKASNNSANNASEFATGTITTKYRQNGK